MIVVAVRTNRFIVSFYWGFFYDVYSSIFIYIYLYYSISFHSHSHATRGTKGVWFNVFDLFGRFHYSGRILNQRIIYFFLFDENISIFCFHRKIMMERNVILLNSVGRTGIHHYILILFNIFSLFLASCMYTPSSIKYLYRCGVVWKQSEFPMTAQKRPFLLEIRNSNMSCENSHENAYMNGIVLWKRIRNSRKSKRISLHASYNCNKSAVRIFYFNFFAALLSLNVDDMHAESRIKTIPEWIWSGCLIMSQSAHTHIKPHQRRHWHRHRHTTPQ